MPPATGSVSPTYPRAVPSLLLALAIILTPLTFSLPDGCADVHVIGARGSGQSGYGDQVEGVVDAITAGARSVGMTASDEPLDYPAVSITDSLGLVLVTGDYARSVDDGAEALRTAVDRAAAECPNTRTVIVGYSQGAHVVKQAFADEHSHPVAAVVLLADPTRDPSQLGIRRLGSPPGEEAGAFGAIRLPDHVRVVAIDVCAAQDVVCDRSSGGFLAHIDGYEVYEADVAAAAIGLLERLPSRRLSPR